MTPGSIVPKGAEVTVVSGLPLGGDHPMHPFIITSDGSLLVDVASATNSCQLKNRTLKSPGDEPCKEQETRGGIWRYDANKTDQKFSPSDRYATGIRNGEGFAIDANGQVFVTQHGRDQLHTNWPEFYKADQEATLPAEEVLALNKGGDYGWPECLLRQLRTKAGARARVRRRRKENRRLRGQDWTRRCFPGALGTERHDALRQRQIPRALSRRRLHRISRFVESRAVSAGRI